ncbi:hypothetical protein [Pseudomonas phage D6]|nr:hypothetical protein [Pseudomonas phage D6]
MKLLNRIAIGMASGVSLGLGGVMLKAGVDNAGKRHQRRDVTILLGSGIVCVTAGLTAVVAAVRDEA